MSEFNNTSIKFKYKKKIVVPSVRNIKIIIDDEICENEIDYVIDQNISEEDISNKDIILFTLDCIFINPDKRYKLIYKNLVIMPNTYNDYEHGIIDMERKKIVKYCNYDNKIVSFCLYGKNKLYLEGAIINAKQYKDEYQDIKCYYYIQS